MTDPVPVPVPGERAVAWARVFPTYRQQFSKALRRGAWYPVLRNDLPDRVTIDMGPRGKVDAPRRLLEIRTSRPSYFSVVIRDGYQPKPRRQSLYNLGRHYAVCPSCSKRFGLWGKPNARDCPDCGHTGEVGWWEA
jgi:hypothetical protein